MNIVNQDSFSPLKFKFLKEWDEKKINQTKLTEFKRTLFNSPKLI